MRQSRDGLILGAHVSTSGGIHLAPARGAAIGATGIQVFTKTPSQWRDPPLAAEAPGALAKSLSQHDIRYIVAHDSYLTNMASPDPILSARSRTSFLRELGRCAALRIPWLVSHPGHYIEDREAGLKRNAEEYTKAVREAPGGVKILIETTAGSGTSLGSRFEELSRLRMLAAADVRHRIGFCADTCHLFSAGYDLRSNYDQVWEDWDRIIGLEHLHCLHLNDSKTPLGSRRDRHEVLGKGSLGSAVFRRIMRDPRLAHVPKILETPKGADGVSNDRSAIARLRRWATEP